ncbi:MAG TPA: FAD-dependent oxidoreductase [Thermoanaerobaculia bacterium]|nr:FAD-dependent oxidoreductase [Thermoanaerobaculia bacterium]
MTGRKKVAILGGGCGAMTAAYYLSSTPELREKLEVTVYQMGWRLGGKGASGRNAAYFDRIEEHGLHVWGGFYYNAFRLMEDAYGALDRPPECPLRTWTDAFRPHNYVVWTEWIDGKWIDWPVEAPATTGVPGEGGEFPTVWEYIEMIVGWLRDFIEGFPHEGVRAAAGDPTAAPSLAARCRSDLHAIGRDFTDLLDGSPSSLLDAAHALSHDLAARDRNRHRAVEHQAVAALVASFHDWIEREWMEEIVSSNAARRIYILADCLVAIVRGIVADGVVFGGFMAIDRWDFAEWLARHGASALALQSAPLRGYYDYFFAYRGGDTACPRMSAGMGLPHLLRLIGAYKGGLFWKMQSGMGDAVFAPLYEICRRNGVRFEFFRRVAGLVPSEDGRSIARIVMARQVDLCVPEYDPLVRPADLPSWPSEPLYDQIDPAQARALRDRGANLEDPWTNWDDVGREELAAGRDFDAAVLGISIGAFPSICRPLMAQRPEWHDMVERLETIQTQALQLWWKPEAPELGWQGGNATGTGFGQPLESWSDMSGVIPRELWPPRERPGTIVYFCGPMKTPETPPPGKDPAFGRGQTDDAWRNAADWCASFVGHLYPGAVDPEDPSRLRFDLLVDPTGAAGPARFAHQYARANYTPSERYVLDLPGTNRFRLEADTSGYDNLALAGDWIFTGLGGAVESAVMAGMQAARALAGVPRRIVGEEKSPWRRKATLRKLV